MLSFVNPNELKQISQQAATAKVEARRLEKERDIERQKELRRQFESREIHEDVVNRVNAAVRLAASQGLHHVDILVFPSRYCTDGGRSINVADKDWPNTLTGYAKKIYDLYQKELKPLGFELHAQIISFPDGFPGDVGMSLSW
jgi:hypothetical protein